jgi:hypothetical protein
MQEKRIFTGGINNDLAFEFLKEDEYRYALNMIIGASDNDDSELINRTGIGHGENLKGNTEITNIDIPLPHNDFKVVGAYEDQLSNSVFYFVSDIRTDDNGKFTHIVDDRECFLFDYNIWNDNGYDAKLNCDKYLDDAGHRILRYWAGEKRIETILASKWLNFSPEFLITGINLVLKEYGDGDNTEGTERQELLYWTDMFNPPRKVNVQKALYFMQSNGLNPNGYNQLNDINTSRVLDNNDVEWVRLLDAVKYPPRFSPDIIFDTDTSILYNNIKDRMFQFAYRYVYDDYEKSAISPISTIGNRNEEYYYNVADIQDNTFGATYYFNEDYYVNNAIDVYINTGNSIVEKIEILVRETNNGDFYLCDSIKKDKELIKDNNIYKYTFRNDIILKPIEKDNNTNGYKLFDNLPIIAKAQNIINDNRIIYGNIIEGFDSKVELDVSLIPEKKYIEITGDTLYFSYIDTYNTIDCDIGQDPSSSDDTSRFIYHISFYTEGQLSIGQKISYKDAISNIYFEHIISEDDYYNGLHLFLEYIKNSILELYRIRMAEIVDCFNNSGYNNLQAELSFNETSSIDFTEDNKSVVSIDFISPLYNIPCNIINTGDCNINIGRATDGEIEVFPNDKSSKFTIHRYTGFKSGTTHSFGLVYYDRANRSNTVLNDIQTSKKTNIYVPFLTEKNIKNDFSYTHINWEIKHEPPCWATHYQWVYSGNRDIKKFIQFTILSSAPKDTSNPQNSNTEWILNLSPLKKYNEDHQKSILIYTYTKGDRVRIITKDPIYTNIIYNDLVDFEVTGFDDSTYSLYVRTLTGANFNPLQGGSLIEIYTPFKSISDEDSVFYEFSKEYAIYTDSNTCKRYHRGELSDQSLTTNASGVFKRGDVYIRERLMTGKQALAFTSFSYIEDFNWSDFYISDYWDKGRPNLIGHNSTNIQGNDDFRRVHRPATIYFSGSFVPSTNINGLSSFPDLSYNDYEVSKGSIQLLKTRDRSVICFQELRVGVIPINERLSHTTSGTITAQNDTVLNEIDYYAGEFGIGIHPEAFASFGYSYYFLDIYRGVVLRLSQDGLTPLSTIYGMENITTKTFSVIKNFEQKNKLKANIYGVYNRKFNQYEFSVEDRVINSTNSQTTLYSEIFKNVNQPRYYTLAFSERANKFTSFMSYLPEYFSSINQDLLSFRNGRLYLHGSNSEYNTFYGVHTPSEIWVVANVSPSNMKIAEAFSQENNVLQYNDKTKLWEVYELYNNQGQDTNLIRDDFEFDESIWYAPFWKDTNTPNVLDPLINGDEIRSGYILLKINNDSKELCRLFAVNIQWINSDRHNV